MIAHAESDPLKARQYLLANLLVDEIVHAESAPFRAQNRPPFAGIFTQNRPLFVRRIGPPLNL